jgi:hypothetical protein
MHIHWSRLAVLGSLIAFPLQAEPLRIAASSPQVQVAVKSGGPRNSDCGFLPEQASQQIEIDPAYVEQSGFLRFSVQGGGEPTLVVIGPAGRFCALPNQGVAQQSGVWLPGRYDLFVGDRQGGRHSVTLTISSRN